METRIWNTDIPLPEILRQYYERKDPGTGTVVIHAGQVKVPGKVKPAMDHVVLEPCVEDPTGGLARIGQSALGRFEISRVQIHHRLGRVSPGGHVLVVLVSSPKRGPAFDACRWVVDEIKREEVIRLVEVEQATGDEKAARRKDDRTDQHND